MYSLTLLLLWFQFQTGSIKSQEHLQDLLRQQGFNSKLVRLKGRKVLFPHPRYRCFNSKLVRLKG